MKKTKLFLITAVALILSANLMLAEGAPQERTKSFSVSPGGKLSVSINPGDIMISTWDKNEVVIKIRGLDEEELNGVEMKQDGKNVSIVYRSDWGWSSDANFSVTVPSQYNLDLKTTGGNIIVQNNITGGVNSDSQGGELRIGDVNGNVNLNTQGGDVKTGNVSGDLSINTMGGDIRTGSLGGKNIKLSTMGGDVNIVKSASGLSVKTYGGDISIGDLGGSSDVKTYGGDISLANVNGNLNLETAGGDISCKSVKGNLKARTGGGDVSLGTVNGSLDVKSGAGDVSAGLVPAANSTSSISVGNGEITLYLPANAKTTVEAVIRVQGGWRSEKESYRINSDFQSNEYKSDDARKEIRAVYEINGGGSKVYLNTTNSDIFIRKSK